jgi:hypothetical protein
MTIGIINSKEEPRSKNQEPRMKAKSQIQNSYPCFLASWLLILVSSPTAFL